MEEPKKTRRTTTAKKQENESKEVIEKKTAKAVRKPAESKPAKAVKQTVEKNQIKEAKEPAEKKTTKSVKQDTEKKPAKVAKETVEKKQTKPAKKSTEKKQVKETVVKRTTRTGKNIEEKEAAKAEKNIEEKKATKIVKKIEGKQPIKANKESPEKIQVKEEIENLAKIQAKLLEVKKELEAKKEVQTMKKEEIKTTNKTSSKAIDNKETKSEPKEKIKKEDINKTKKESKNKKYLEISIGLIIAIVVIVGLVILNVKLGMHAYNIVTKDEPANSEANLDKEENINVTQEVGNVLSNDNRIVEELIEKITFAPNVTATIYDVGTFNSSNIPNELKLKVGWAKTSEVNKLKSMNENNEPVEAIEVQTLSQSIKEIFGPDVAHKNESFDDSKVSTFSANQAKISYDSGLYTSTPKQSENEVAPLIYQEVQKVVKYSEKIMIYVKTAYINVEEDKYVAYKNFDNNKFSEKLLEIAPEQLFDEVSFNQATGEGSISITENNALNNIRSKLNTYKYTFTLNEATQKYHLTGFGQEESII